MKPAAKTALGCLAVLGAGFCLLVALILYGARGFDASKKDPRKLYMEFVQKEISATVKVHSAVGRVTPIGGGGITFKLTLGQKDLDDLISSKGLRRTDSLPLAPERFAELKHPEYYWTNHDKTWSSSENGTTVWLVVDRESGLAFYSVISI